MPRQKIDGLMLAAATLLVPACAVVAWRDQWWPIVLFLVWAFAAALVAGIACRRAYRRETDRLAERASRDIVKSRQDLVGTLSHHRHDWMNELQILYGYLRMQKIDKAIAVVDRIKEDMERDSRISRLGSPELSAYLLSFRTFCDTMTLDARVDEHLQASCVVSAGPERVMRAAIGLINAYRVRASAATAEENMLRIVFLEASGELRIATIYEGAWSAWSSLREDVSQSLPDGARLSAPVEGDEEDDARKLTVVVPFD
ncbi:Spo0B domain-containing protein [Cohnella hashimotonis]|uniref:Spo0B domain-containing protein n=1 Tax=Cohnella hashimotonis TaxID=2826895 RepID=A0ABT6TDG4_9BACL|nr:Spo0B domain-containing protein [Cohnella hashimotonis]MDI4644867.1 Spo0B domain-containing protein [Cohnella hashimotonis]